MAAPSFPKPSKWFGKKRFKWNLHLHRHRQPRPKPSLPNPNSKKADEFLEAFRRFDLDGDGKISSEELKSFFDWAGDDVSIAKAEAAMKDLDSDGDGLMDYDDFMRLMEMGRSGGGGDEDEGEEKEDLRRAFEMFEVEKGSGFITPHGLQRVLSDLERRGRMRSVRP